MKKRIVITLLCVFLAAAALLLLIKAESAADEYCRYILKNVVHGRINDRICAYFAENEGLFGAVCRYSYTENGSLSAITLDSAAVNRVRFELERVIVGEIEKLKSECFYMPLGNITGLKLLSDRGPGIKIKIVPLGNVECDTVNSFESVGINHTLHRVGLKFTSCFGGAPPFAGDVYETEFYAMLCENLIVGSVPDVYFN